MAIDASIYGALGTRPVSIADYDQQNQQLQQNALNLQRSKQQLDAYTQDQAEKASLRNYLQSAPDLSSAAGYNGLMAAAPTLGPGIHKAYQDSLTSQALAAKDTAQAGNFTADAAKTRQQTQYEALQHGIQSLTAASTPDAAKQAVMDGVNKGYWSMQDAQQKVAQIPTDPAAYQDWRIQQLKTILPAADLLRANAPNVSTHNTGGSTVTLATDPLTGKTAPVNTIANTQSPDNAATNATSRANNSANIAKDFAVAGLNPDGTLSMGNKDSLIDMLGNYQLDPKQALARASIGQRAALVAAVQQKYPGWDETTYDAKKGAAQKFTYGDQGNQLRSNATATEHLDQLEQLAGALNNGDIRVINQIGNAFGIQAGTPPAQVFNAVRHIVGQEVVKSIVAGGGGEGERKDAADAFDSSSSPQQFLQTKAAVKNIMKAQADNLMEQRRAAGLPDSTLPHYGHAGGATAAPSGVPDDIAAILAKHGTK